MLTSAPTTAPPVGSTTRPASDAAVRACWAPAVADIATERATAAISRLKSLLMGSPPLSPACPWHAALAWHAREHGVKRGFSRILLSSGRSCRQARGASGRNDPADPV